MPQQDTQAAVDINMFSVKNRLPSLVYWILIIAVLYVHNTCLITGGGKNARSEFVDVHEGSTLVDPSTTYCACYC